MKAFEILDINKMMALLLTRNTFDSFFFEKADITMGTTMTLDGKRNMSWYAGDVEDEEKQNQTEFVRWKDVKDYVYEFIKGKRTPQKMVISLKLDEKGEELFQKTMGLQISQKKMDFLLQFRYVEDQLHLVTGVAQKEFTMEKTWEVAWDDFLEKILKGWKISFVKII